MVYLDNAATTMVCAAAADAALDIWRNMPGNPSSLHKLGVNAEQALNRARGIVAQAMGCGAHDLYFTASGTEANNIACLGAARARKAWGHEVVVTGYEHPSVHNAVMALRREGFTVHVVKPGVSGTINADILLKAVHKNTALVACMQVNNETGAMVDVAALAAAVKAINKRTAFHCDAVQGFLKHPLPIDGTIDTVAISGHKVHAPKGVGALYMRKGFHTEPLLYGGGQEKGVRSGTENVAFAAAFAAAVRQADNMQHTKTHAAALRQLLRELLGGLDGIAIHSPADASPYIFNFSLLGFRSETVLHFLEDRGIYVSGGSACSKGARSHTLTAMGLPDAMVDSAIRVSFSGDNTQEDVIALVDGLKDAQRTLVKTKG